MTLTECYCNRIAIMTGHVRPHPVADISRRRPDPELHPGRGASRDLRQSTVSQHIRKLEAAAGPSPLPARHPYRRDHRRWRGDDRIRRRHPGGERARARYFAGSQVRGRLRFGTSEDFVASRLPEVLREFVRTHPLVDVELTVGLSGELNEKLGRGELDLVCGKRRPGEDRGRLVWRDRLSWVSGDLQALDGARQTGAARSSIRRPASPARSRSPHSSGAAAPGASCAPAAA